MEVQSKDNLEIESETHTAPVLVTREVPGHFTRREYSDAHLTHRQLFFIGFLTLHHTVG